MPTRLKHAKKARKPRRKSKDTKSKQLTPGEWFEKLVARNLAWTATSFSNHSPGVNCFDFVSLLLRRGFRAFFACFRRVGMLFQRFPFRIKRSTLRCNHGFDKHFRSISGPNRERAGATRTGNP